MNFKKLLSFLLMSFALVQMASAETYVLNEGESNFSTISSKEYELSGEPGQLTFQAKCVPIKVIFDYWGGDLKVAQKVNGNWERIFSETPPKNSYKAYGPYTLKRNATHIKFYTETGATGYKYFKDIKVTMASYLETDKSSVSFPTTIIGNNVTASFTVNHSNIAPLTVSSSDNSLWTPNITTITESGLGKHGSKLITVTLNAKEANTHIGKITISNGTQKVDVALSCVVNKKPQTLTWKDNIDVLTLLDTVENAATANSNLAVTYASSDAGVLKVENGKLIPVAAGNVLITATQVGNDEWAEISVQKSFMVTDKQIQTITWEQDFYKLRVGDAAVNLTATASSGLAVTYTSANENVVRVSGTQLEIVGAGETTLTATQAGDDMNWAAAVPVDLAVRVREVSADCDEYSLYNLGRYNMGNDGSKTIDLPRPGAKLSYRLYLPGSATGELVIKAIRADGTSTEVQKISNLYDLANKFTGKHVSFKDLYVDSKAVKLHFDVNGTLEKKIDQIYLTQATFLETSVAALNFGNIEIGTTANKSFNVLYSNLPEKVEIAHENELFVLSGGMEFGTGCGDHGTKNIGIAITPRIQGEVHDTIVVTSNNRVIRVPIVANVVKKTQALDWQQDLSTLAIDDTLTLNASASSGLAVTYVSSNPEVAVVDTLNRLYFLTVGSAEITASQDGDSTYFAAQSMTKAVTLGQIVPTITTNPIASGITYGQALEESILTNAAASVAGTFSWIEATMIPDAGDEINFEVIFTPENQVYYENVIFEVPVNVARASQAITWVQDLFMISQGDTVILNGVSDAGIPLSYSSLEPCVRISGDTLFALTAGSGSVVASQVGNNNYKPASDVALNFSVLSTGLEITTPPTASDITYGQSLAFSTLTGGVASVAGQFAWSDPSIIPNAGQNQEFEVKFTVDGEQPVLFNVKLNVAKADQSIIWEQELTGLTVADTVLLTATSSAALPITYTVSDTTVAKIEGGQLQTLKVGEVRVLAQQLGNDNFNKASSIALFAYITVEAGIFDVEKDGNMQLYPNPTSDYLLVGTSAGQTISVYDMHGTLVLQQQADAIQTKVNVQGLSVGRYAIVLSTSVNASRSKIFLKQ